MQPFTVLFDMYLLGDSVTEIIYNLKWDLELLYDKFNNIDFIKELIKIIIKLGVIKWL